MASSAASAAAGAASLTTECAAGAEPAQPAAKGESAGIPGEDYRIASGRIRQSVMGWCFNPMPTDTLIDACHAMGMPAMEGISRSHYSRLRKLGMHVALVSSHGFKQGPLTRENHAMCRDKLREAIDVAVEYQSPSVITFTGMREKGVSDDQAMRNCVACWKDVIGYAEEKGVNLCLEHLNSRDDTHPMKGHPGYFGDDVDLCVELIKQVDSPRMKLLFDIY
ncbi:MAG: TIM barrel protein, partial [Planctomycetales bacterium]|nr:TIM barrel protein [Planctomycetales bacterium]